MTTKKFIKRLVTRAIPIAIITYFCWPLTAVYTVASIYDVMRMNNKDKGFIFTQYFMVNGLLTWLLSPFNMLIDIICLPFINKQIYKLEDLPKLHQKEIKIILEGTPRKFLTDALNELSEKGERTMLFYRWYGFNVENKYPVPLFHTNFKRVLTIGVSSFGAQSQTSWHFGWSRAGVRVLINIDEIVGEGAYLDTNNQRHVWKTDGPLFIFDDTVIHQSVNHTDLTRNNLFIDVTRPSMFPFLINGIVKFFGYLSAKTPALTKASKWNVVK